MSDKTKTSLLIATLLASIALGTLTPVGKAASKQAPPQSLAYGGHNFDRPPNDFQDEGHTTTVAFMMSSRKKLDRRRQLQLRAAQIGILHSEGLSSASGSCGRGRYRDSISGKCRGPADSSGSALGSL
jgi:hypothetical protein